MKHTLLMLVPLANVEWAVQREEDAPIPVESDEPASAERTARRLAREFNEKSGGGWHTVCRVHETPWVRR